MRAQFQHCLCNRILGIILAGILFVSLSGCGEKAPKQFSERVGENSSSDTLGTTKEANMSYGKSANLLASKNFLLLESKGSNGRAVRHIMIIRESLVVSVSEGVDVSDQEAAATMAGQLYALRSGETMLKRDVIVSGDEIFQKASVNHFVKASDLLGDLKIPSGWDVPVFSVAWETY